MIEKTKWKKTVYMHWLTNDWTLTIIVLIKHPKHKPNALRTKIVTQTRAHYTGSLPKLITLIKLNEKLTAHLNNFSQEKVWIESHSKTSSNILLSIVVRLTHFIVKQIFFSMQKL